MTRNISPAQAASWLASGEAVLIDVREPDEFRDEHIAYAQSLPLGALPGLLDALSLPPGRKLIFQCLKGGRGQQACALAAAKGETFNIEGGITAWKQQGLPTVTGGKTPRLSIFRQVQIIVGALVALLVALGFTGLTAGFALAGLLGAALFFAGLTGWCGLALLLSKMPWNK